jgi:hypothetical protein
MGKALGMKKLIELLREEVPDVELGNFSRPIRRPLQDQQVSTSSVI